LDTCPQNPASLGIVRRASETAGMSKHVLFHQGIEAFNRRDVDAFLEICHPDCELQPFLRARDDDSPYRASDGIRQWFAATDAAFEEVRKERSSSAKRTEPCSPSASSTSGAGPAASR